MPIVFGNINPVSASSTGILTVDNGLTANTPTNAELGGALTLDTLIALGAFIFQITDGAVNLKLTPGASPVATLGAAVGSANSRVDFGKNFWQIIFNHGANSNTINQFQNSPIAISEAETQTGLVYNFNYNTNQFLNNRAITDVGGVKALIISSGGTIYALISGQVFTGNISAPNLSGTNTGDQNLTPYALLASPTFTGTPAAPTAAPGTNTTELATTAFVAAVKALCALLSGATFTGAISATNLSGTNTGDQNLTPYALLAGAAFSGNITAPNVDNILASAKLINIVATQTVISFVAPITGGYVVNIYQSMIAFTSGSAAMSVTYTNVNNSPQTRTLGSLTAVGDLTSGPIQFGAKSGTTISVIITVAGTNTCDVGAAIIQIF